MFFNPTDRIWGSESRRFLTPIMWPLFRFLSSFSPQVSRVLCWLVEMFGRWFCERNECRRWLLLLSCSLFILLRALGCDYELDTRSCLVTVCLSRHKQNQYFSLIMLISAGGSWSWLSRGLLSVFVRGFLNVWFTWVFHIFCLLLPLLVMCCCSN